MLNQQYQLIGQFKKGTPILPNLNNLHVYYWTIVSKGLVINYGEVGGGATKWGNRGSETFCAPPLSGHGKTFRAPLLKSGNFSRPPYNIAKTSSYHVKTIPKLVVPPLQHG